MPKKNRTLIARCIAVLPLAAPLLALAADPPQYRITDLGVVAPNTSSGAQAISADGHYIAGRNTTPRLGGTSWSATLWTADGSTTLGAGLAGQNFGQAYGVNNAGLSVGQLAINANGTAPVPAMWSNGKLTQLAMPAGFAIGRAYDVNNAGLAAGSVGTDLGEYAALYDTTGNTVSTIAATAADGAFMRTAYAISDNGLAVGAGITAAGMPYEAVVYDSRKNLLNTLPMIGTPNSSQAYNISANGQYVVGSSTTGTQSQAFLWSLQDGTVTAALPTGYTTGELRAVNDSGMAVGNASKVYSTAWLYADGNSYNLADLVVNPAGWNFRTTTNFAAYGIGDDGTIVGWASYGGSIHAYMMTAVPEPQSWALMLGGLMGVGGIIRRRRG